LDRSLISQTFPSDHHALAPETARHSSHRIIINTTTSHLFRYGGFGMTASAVHCPECGSEAFNKYGRTSNGKKRFLCLVCHRQFVLNPSRNFQSQKPRCRACGMPMYIYMRDTDIIRYRCAAYPLCKSYLKRPIEELQKPKLNF
jgi:hypothetical protein